MGVVHKLKPVVIEYIIAQKQGNPSLSCRKLVPLISKKFRIKVSKSSINAILKSAGTSTPVGKPSEIYIDFAGAFFLKAADAKIRASWEITQAVKSRIKDIPETMLQAYNEVLIYSGLFGLKSPLELNEYQGSGLWALTGLRFNKFIPSRINDYYNILCDKRIYYDVALRLVSLYTHLSQLKVAFAQEETMAEEFSVLLFNLHKYVQKEFFPPLYQNLDFSQMRQQFYSVGGFAHSTAQSLIIRLSEKRHFDEELDLGTACRKVNALEVKSSLGQKIYLQPSI